MFSPGDISNGSEWINFSVLVQHVLGFNITGEDIPTQRKVLLKAKGTMLLTPHFSYVVREMLEA